MKDLCIAKLISTPAAGCAREDATEISDSTSSILMDTCPFYARRVESNGALAPYPFIRPEHVSSIQPAKPLYVGEHAMLVTLTDAGAERMLKQTTDAVGQRIAFFCGQTELDQAVIRGAVSKTFRVFVSDGNGT